MDSAHSLILNEEAFKKIEEHKKPVYVFEWLRSLDKLLVAAQKVSFDEIFPMNNIMEMYEFPLNNRKTISDFPYCVLLLYFSMDKVGCKSMPKEIGRTIDNTNSRSTGTTNTKTTGQLFINAIFRW